MTTVEAHSSLLNMLVTFDLAEIEELMPQQTRKQLEAELDWYGAVDYIWNELWNLKKNI